MTADKDLLELAAKAARYKLEILEGRLCIKHGDSSCTPMWSPWNPLTDDGDALRLAVSIAGKNWSFTDLDDSKFGIPVWYTKDDPCAATRRAIVRAAAEIGKSMKGTP